MTDVIDILKTDPESIIGKTVSYNLLGIGDMEFVVAKYKIREETYICDGEEGVEIYYAISPGSGFYPVYKTNCVLL